MPECAGPLTYYGVKKERVVGAAVLTSDIGLSLEPDDGCLIHRARLDDRPSLGPRDVHGPVEQVLVVCKISLVELTIIQCLKTKKCKRP